MEMNPQQIPYQWIKIIPGHRSYFIPQPSIIFSADAEVSKLNLPAEKASLPLVPVFRDDTYSK